MAAKKAQSVERIDDDHRFSAATAILRTLEDGVAQIERDADSLRIEDYLGQAPHDHRKPRTGRSAMLQERLKKNRATQKTAEPGPTTSDLPSIVAAALEVLRGARPPARLNRKAIITQLEGDRDLIYQAIREQTAIVNGIRDELVTAQNMRDREAWLAIQLRKFRALQTVVAIKEEEDDFRKSRAEAGYTWRADILPTTAARPMLILGSERDWDSEISRARRFLEESKTL